MSGNKSRFHTENYIDFQLSLLSVLGVFIEAVPQKVEFERGVNRQAVLPQADHVIQNKFHSLYAGAS